MCWIEVIFESLPVDIFLSESSVYGKICWGIQNNWFDHETHQSFRKCWAFFLTSLKIGDNIFYDHKKRYLCNFSDYSLDDSFCLWRAPNHFSPNSLNKSLLPIVIMGFNVGQCRKLKLIISAWMLNNWSRKMMRQGFSQKISLLDFCRIQFHICQSGWFFLLKYLSQSWADIFEQTFCSARIIQIIWFRLKVKSSSNNSKACFKTIDNISKYQWFGSDTLNRKSLL